MKRMLTMAVAAATIAVSLAASAGDASAQWRGRGWGWGPGIAAGILGGAIIGGAIANSRAYAPAPAGWAYYPDYREPFLSPTATGRACRSTTPTVMSFRGGDGRASSARTDRRDPCDNSGPAVRKHRRALCLFDRSA